MRIRFPITIGSFDLWFDGVAPFQSQGISVPEVGQVFVIFDGQGQNALVYQDGIRGFMLDNFAAAGLANEANLIARSRSTNA